MTETATEKEQATKIIGNFEEVYDKVLIELDTLHKGVFDEDEASSRAAMCLIAQASLLSALASADLRARSLKRDIDFAKADAYARLKKTPSEDGKKVTESALAQLVIKDEEVRRISVEQSEAERDYKHLSNILALLRDAHITFRSIKKGV